MPACGISRSARFCRRKPFRNSPMCWRSSARGRAAGRAWHRAGAERARRQRRAGIRRRRNRLGGLGNRRTQPRQRQPLARPGHRQRQEALRIARQESAQADRFGGYFDGAGMFDHRRRRSEGSDPARRKMLRGRRRCRRGRRHRRLCRPESGRRTDRRGGQDRRLAAGVRAPARHPRHGNCERVRGARCRRADSRRLARRPRRLPLRPRRHRQCGVRRPGVPVREQGFCHRHRCGETHRRARYPARGDAGGDALRRPRARGAAGQEHQGSDGCE